MNGNTSLLPPAGVYISHPIDLPGRTFIPTRSVTLSIVILFFVKSLYKLRFLRQLIMYTKSESVNTISRPRCEKDNYGAI